MTKDPNKRIIFGSYSTVDSFEDDVPEGEINLMVVIFRCLFKKGFKSYLSDTIKYALMHSKCYRGSLASDVLIFEECYDAISIFKKVKYENRKNSNSISF